MKKTNELIFFLDPIANTICLWTGDPTTEHEAEMDDSGDILMMDKKKQVIGFEKINFLPETIHKNVRKSLQTKTIKQLRGRIS